MTETATPHAARVDQQDAADAYLPQLPPIAGDTSLLAAIEQSRRLIHESQRILAESRRIASPRD